MHAIEDWGEVGGGRHRFVWKVRNYRTTTDRLKHGQKISSSEFQIGQYSWFLDLYPNGYKAPHFVSFYLHAGHATEARSIRLPFTMLVFDHRRAEFMPFASEWRHTR